VKELDERVFVERVLTEWWSSAAHSLPWASMALDDRFGRLRPLVSALVSAGLRAPMGGARRGIIAAAIEHGRFRGGQGGTWELLLFELDYLEDGLRAVVHDCDLSPAITLLLEREMEHGLRVAKSACAFGLRESLRQRAAGSALDELGGTGHGA
jgi:hypothetical protein